MSSPDKVATKTRQSWHAQNPDAALRAFETDPKRGLDSAEVHQRQQQYGPNRLPEARQRSALKRLLAQFHNVLIYVLIAAAIVTAAIGHWIDTGVILAVVVVNAIIGFIQEGKAENALKAIRQMLSPQAMVLRDGHHVTVPAEDLVPGDIVELQSGDRVPADMRLLTVKNVKAEEAALTGESVPVDKTVAAVAEGAALGDRTCLAFSSTLITSGKASGVVIGTASNTEIGRISAMLAGVETLTTPLLQQMSQFARTLTLAIVALATATCLFGVLVRDYSLTDMFLAAVGLAVAAIPEGLPAIMTITLAIGVQRMAARKAIIRRLPAVETLGSVTVICSDKTGTLTRNEMTVRSVLTACADYAVSGGGYDPHGSFSEADQEIDIGSHQLLEQIARACLLCNDAEVRQGNDGWELHGDPTEGALITLGLKAGLETAFEREAWPRTDVIPFESEHQFMATLHHDHQGHGVIYLKGAPEKVLALCAQQQGENSIESLDRNQWQQRLDDTAARGQRLIAIAMLEVDAEHIELRFDDIDGNLTLLGLVGMIDPPRDDAIAAVAQCQSAGIRVKMITGDHAITARAIGEQMGIGTNGKVLSGEELEQMTAGALRQVVEETDVFARASPEHKLRLVEAMQANGHVVAMTGDGVNDAPALKRANVGTAMGQKGTEVAKESAEMVLVHDNFSAIAHAVEEGRTVYDNLRKSILFILPTNGGEALTLIAAILMGRMLPITPVQILWINMITAVTLALALAFEPPEGSVMQRPPRNPREPILTPMFLWRILFVSLILVAGTFGLFLWEREQGMSLEYARTVAVNTLVLFEIFYLFNSRYIEAPVLNVQGLLGNRYALLAIVILLAFQMLITYLPLAQHLFATTAIDAAAWLRIVVVTSSVLFLVEAEKALVRLSHRRRK